MGFGVYVQVDLVVDPDNGPVGTQQAGRHRPQRRQRLPGQRQGGGQGAGRSDRRQLGEQEVAGHFPAEPVGRGKHDQLAQAPGGGAVPGAGAALVELYAERAEECHSHPVDGQGIGSLNRSGGHIRIIARLAGANSGKAVDPAMPKSIPSVRP